MANRHPYCPEGPSQTGTEFGILPAYNPRSRSICLIYLQQLFFAPSSPIAEQLRRPSQFCLCGTAALGCACCGRPGLLFVASACPERSRRASRRRSALSWCGRPARSGRSSARQQLVVGEHISLHKLSELICSHGHHRSRHETPVEALALRPAKIRASAVLGLSPGNSPGRGEPSV